MKKTLLLCGMLLALSATIASAAGVNLAWNQCVGGGGAVNESFACATNSGSHILVASVRAPDGINLWTSFETEVQLQSDLATLPAWWQLRNQTNQTGQCRNNAAPATLTASADFTLGFTGCEDVFGGGGSGGIGTYLVGFGGANRARLLCVFSVPSAAQAPLTPGTEYYAARFGITNFKTVGSTGCADCQAGACLVCTYVKCVQPAGAPGGNITVSNVAERNFATWQGGDASCPGATPTKSTTWGSVKALYR
jgi:hypothetical protein